MSGRRHIGFLGVLDHHGAHGELWCLQELVLLGMLRGAERHWSLPLNGSHLARREILCNLRMEICKMILLVLLADTYFRRLIYWIETVSGLEMVAFEAVLGVLEIEVLLLPRLEHLLNCRYTGNVDRALSHGPFDR